MYIIYTCICLLILIMYIGMASKAPWERGPQRRWSSRASWQPRPCPRSGRSSSSPCRSCRSTPSAKPLLRSLNLKERGETSSPARPRPCCLLALPAGSSWPNKVRTKSSGRHAAPDLSHRHRTLADHHHVLGHCRGLPTHGRTALFEALLLASRKHPVPTTGIYVYICIYTHNIYI